MQAEVIALRGSQWLQLFHEQAQSGQTAEQWCEEHQIARSTYYRWKKALREKFLAQLEAEQERPGPPAAAGGPGEPQFAALAIPEMVRKAAPASGSTQASRAPVLRIRIGETEIEVPEGIESRHLEMVLKAVQDAR